MLLKRSFLFLQGPHGSFFRELGRELSSKGADVTRVNLCGGDVWDWPFGALCYHGRTSDWSEWIARLMERREVTDLLVYGDWRPHHREAVHIARLCGIRVWAFDEGYIRPDWITMEEGGVNGNSHLPHTPGDVRSACCGDMVEPGSVQASNPLRLRQFKAFLYAAFSILGRRNTSCTVGWSSAIWMPYQVAI